MSTAEILSFVSLISYVAAAVCLLLAIFFWFFFRIPAVYGDLSGRTAKKSIEKRRLANIQSGRKSYCPSPANAERGKITETMSQTAKPKAETVQTEKLAVPQVNTEQTAPLASCQTTPSYTKVSTAALDAPEAPGAVPQNEEDEGTVALKVEAAPARTVSGRQLTMLNDVILIHTEEVIA